MVLADVDQTVSHQDKAQAYPLQNGSQLPASAVTTEESRDSLRRHERPLISPSIGHIKVRPASIE